MMSGSLDHTRIERFQKVYNYQMFRKSMIDILQDAGFDTRHYEEGAVDAVTLKLLRNLLGEKKLNEYIMELSPPRLNLN